MIPFTLNLKLLAAAVLALGLFGAGLWLRGVVADNQALTLAVKQQRADLKAASDQVAQMNRQDAADQKLFETSEQRKAELNKELNQKLRELKAAREALDAATQSCFDRELPAAYLERLP